MSKARGELLGSDEADGDCRHGRREYGTQHRRGDVSCEYHRQGRRLDDGDGRGGERGNAPDQQRALVPGVSMNARSGACNEIPTKPLTVGTRPMMAWVQCAWPIRKIPTYGPSPPRTSASRISIKVESSVEGWGDDADNP